MLIILTSNDVRREAKNIIPIFLELTEQTADHRPEKKHLLIAAHECHELNPVYTASHFFTISLYTFADIMSIVTTYFIVLIQLQG